MTLAVAALMSLLLAAPGAADEAKAGDAFVLETDSFALVLGSDGRVDSLVDRATGTNHCASSAGAPFALVKRGVESFPATATTYEAGQLAVEFSGAAARAVFAVKPERRRLVFELTALTGDGIDELVFGQVPLTLKGDASEPFGVSPLALNIETNCLQIPGVSSGLQGFIAVRRFGFTGARGAIVAAPMAELRDALKDAVSSSSDLPQSSLGGPWALDAAINQGSYLIDAEGVITEENVGEWIEAARRVGASQIDFHGGHSFRWGDFEPNRELYPRGRDSLKAVVDAIHAAGMAAGLHTYAFFIAKDTPWVTPVPDPELDKDAVFTLAADLGTAEASVPVDESTQAMSAVTGFHVRNSVTLQIDDELITYKGIAKEPPYAFTECERGACGTRPAPHAKGAKVHHLKECFGLFSPKGDSKLFAEVAQRTADAYNACGFDMLYLDALDASDLPAGGEYAWHYQAKFAFELARRLERPAVMEMSTFSHHLWVVRSRLEAWDVPSRGVKSFVDFHVLRNRRWQNAFLPTHLGWWGIFNWDGVHPERTFPDDVEYVCAKALATDSSLSYLVGFAPKDFAGGNARRMAAITKRYEDLRRAGTVPESVKARLAEPGAEFSLQTTADGGWQFHPTRYSEHELTLGNGPARFTTVNAYGAQPLRLRIEVPMSAQAWDSPEGQVLAEFKVPGEFGPAEAQEGVSGSLEIGPDEAGAVLRAENTGTDPSRAWLCFRKEFAPAIDFAGKGLGLWVEGDGQGEVVNVQVRSPQHLTGGFADHYIHVDFTGPRYFALIEPESDELTRYQWPHTRRWQDFLAEPDKNAQYSYPMYHVWVHYKQISSLTVGVNNLPVGKPVRVGLGPIKALPLESRALVNPVVTVGDTTLRFPVELNSGSYLEFNGFDDCKAYDAKGELIGPVIPGGGAPVLAAGENACALDAAPGANGPARAKLTVISYGEPLRP